jgi:hypothetical protein
MEHNVGMLAEAAEKFAASQGRSDRVAIGTGVGRQNEAIAPLDVFEYFPQHGSMLGERADFFSSNGPVARRSSFYTAAIDPE